MADGVKIFLCSIGLGHHFQVFHTKGYDEESDIPHLTVSDLNSVGITNPSEINRILKAAQSFKQSPAYKLRCWLRESGLEHYYEGFVQSGIVLLSDVANLSLPDEDLYDELEITLPGHKKRLEYAVDALKNHPDSKLNRDRSSEAENVQVVTEGWWGFPTYLPNAKFPFLCVQACIRSTLPSSTAKSVSFMVDSGSDVSTLRESIIEELKLEAITTVRSCGAYGSQRTTMYKAHIILGDCLLETEVIGSTYDSLGSRVLRNFRHSIDDTRHKWMRVKDMCHTNSGNRAQQSSNAHSSAPQNTADGNSASQSTERNSALRRAETVSMSKSAEQPMAENKGKNTGTLHKKSEMEEDSQTHFRSSSSGGGSGNGLTRGSIGGKSSSSEKGEDEADFIVFAQPRIDGTQTLRTFNTVVGDSGQPAFKISILEAEERRPAHIYSTMPQPSSSSTSAFDGERASLSKRMHPPPPPQPSFSSPLHEAGSGAGSPFKQTYHHMSSTESNKFHGSPAKRVFTTSKQAEGDGDGVLSPFKLSTAVLSSASSQTLSSSSMSPSSSSVAASSSAAATRQGGQLTLSQDGTLSLVFDPSGEGGKT